MTKQATKKPEPKEEGPSSNDLLASLMSTHKADHYNQVEAKHLFISSGSLILDQYVKVRSGGVCRLSAKQPEAGKSSQSFVFAQNYMAVMPKSKTIYVKAEGRLSPEIQARTGMRFVTDPAEWSMGSVFVFSSNVFEVVADVIEKLIKDMHEKGEHLCVIIDSLDGLILRKDLEVKGIDGNVMVAGVPKLTKLLFRRLALPITHYDALLLITGQYSADIKIDPYAPAVPRLGDSSGGSSLPHQCDYVLSYAPRYGGDLILEDENAKPDPIKNKTVGVWATIEIKKSATDTTGTKVKIPIKKGRVGPAIWLEREVGDIAVGWELYKKAGSWLTLQADHPIIAEGIKEGIEFKEKVQGMNGLYEYIESDKRVFEWIYGKLRKMLIQEDAT